MEQALITSITGQNESYLAEFFVEKGYQVRGTIGRNSSFNTGRVEHIYKNECVWGMHNRKQLNLHYGDVTDSSSLIRLINDIVPNEIYNSAAQSHFKASFEVPQCNADDDGKGCK